MSVDTGGSINSAQMKEFSEKMARMEGGLATATANIAVLTEDNVALKADNANFVRYTKPPPTRFFRVGFQRSFKVVAYRKPQLDLWLLHNAQ